MKKIIRLKSKFIFGAGGFLIIFLIFSLTACSGQEKGNGASPSRDSTKTLFAYVGANLKEPVSELAADFLAETGIQVELTFNNAGGLLNQATTMEEGDLYMPGGISFIEMARQKDCIDQVMGPIAYHIPVMITPAGNPAQIFQVEDLAEDGVELIVPHLESTAIGKTARKIFQKTVKAVEIEENILAELESPAKVLTAIIMGQGNCGIVEYSNLPLGEDREKIEVVEIDPGINERDEIPIASLVYSQKTDLAQKFMDYVVEKGPQVFEKHGFKTQ